MWSLRSSLTSLPVKWGNLPSWAPCPIFWSLHLADCQVFHESIFEHSGAMVTIFLEHYLCSGEDHRQKQEWAILLSRQGWVQGINTHIYVRPQESVLEKVSEDIWRFTNVLEASRTYAEFQSCKHVTLERKLTVAFISKIKKTAEETLWQWFLVSYAYPHFSWALPFVLYYTCQGHHIVSQLRQYYHFMLGSVPTSLIPQMGAQWRPKGMIQTAWSLGSSETNILSRVHNSAIQLANWPWKTCF